MGLNTFLEFLYFCLALVISVFTLDFLFYTISKVKPVIFTPLFASDFERCKWLFSEIKIPYEVKKYNNKHTTIYLKSGCLSFDEFGKFKQ